MREVLFEAVHALLQFNAFPISCPSNIFYLSIILLSVPSCARSSRGESNVYEKFQLTSNAIGMVCLALFMTACMSSTFAFPISFFVLFFL